MQGFGRRRPDGGRVGRSSREASSRAGMLVDGYVSLTPSILDACDFIFGLMFLVFHFVLDLDV